MATIDALLDVLISIKREHDIIKKLKALRATYKTEHQIMHSLLKCIYDKSQNPVQYAAGTFVIDITEDGKPENLLEVQSTELEEKKGLVGAEMRRIQAACRELNVQRMELSKARKGHLKVVT